MARQNRSGSTEDDREFCKNEADRLARAYPTLHSLGARTSNRIISRASGKEPKTPVHLVGSSTGQPLSRQNPNPVQIVRSGLDIRGETTRPYYTAAPPVREKRGNRYPFWANQEAWRGYYYYSLPLDPADASWDSLHPGLNRPRYSRRQ